MTRHQRHATALMVLATVFLATTGCQAQDQAQEARTTDEGALNLVHADEFGTSFVVGPPAATIPTAPVEVEIWRFADRQERMTQTWGWDSSWSRVRIDCQDKTRQPLLQRTYLDGELTQEVTPTVGARAPVGQGHREEEDYVCNPQRPAAETQMAAPEAARAWADAHYDRVRTSPSR